MASKTSTSDFSFPESVFPGQLLCPEYDIKQQDGQDIVYKFVSGQGTKLQSYMYNNNKVNVVTATLLGAVVCEEIGPALSKPDQDVSRDKSHAHENVSERVTKTVSVSVLKREDFPAKREVNDDFANNLPKEGDIVLTRVTRISLQRANVEILAVENQTVPVDSGVGSNGSGISSVGGGSGAATFSISQASSDLGETFRAIIRSQDVRATQRDSVKILECFKPGDIVRAQVLSLGDGTNYYLTTARNDLGVVFAKAAGGSAGLMYAIDWQTMVVPSTGATEKRKCAKPF